MPEGDNLTWHDTVAAADLEDSTPKEFQLGDRLLALVRVGENIYAVDCICTHEFALLSDGYVENNTIECPLHAARFDLRTGKVLDPPAETDLKTYPVRLSGNVVQVGLPLTKG